MLLKQTQFNNNCQTPIDSIKNPQRTKKKQYNASVNNPMTQKFSNIKLGSTISIGKTSFAKELQKMKQDYIVRTQYIRVKDDGFLDEIYQINIEKMKKKYSKYSNFEQLNIPKEMIHQLKRFGYYEINTFMRMAATHLLFEFRSLLEYDNVWDRDTIIAITSLAFLKLDCLKPQVLIICPDDAQAIQLQVILEVLNINYLNLVRVSNKNKIVDDRHKLITAQVVLGTADRINYVIKQKMMHTLLLESVVFQEFSLTSDLGFCNDMKNIMHMIPSSTSRHFFFSQNFNENEHEIIDI